MKKHKKFKLIDLFAGAGGLTLGFTDRRFCGEYECVLGIDNDASAVKSHNINFGNHSLCANIEDWLMTSPDIPKADIVIGGPPCQGFSLLNKKRKNDERRALWEPFMDVVEISEASSFVIENVPGLLKSSEFSQITKKANELGFSIGAGLLNSADYGAPQTRKRAIIVGSKIPSEVLDSTFPPMKTHSNNDEGKFLPWVTVNDAIADLPEPIGTEFRQCNPPLNLHFGRTPTEKSLQRYKAVPPGGNRFDLQRNAPDITPDCWIRKTSGGTDLFGRLWWDRPSVTIRTEFFKPEKGRYLHPDKHRPITHREAARLMGFPDNFIFVGTKIEVAKQIGNAVPPVLGGAIAKMVARHLMYAEQIKSKARKVA